MIKIEERIKEILEAEPNYNAEQTWREINRRIPLKEVIDIMTEIEAKRQNLVDPEKLNEFKRLLTSDVI